MAEAISDVELKRHAQELLDGKAKALLDENQLTMRVMRKLLEEKLGLPEGSLDAKKKAIATIVKEALELEPQAAAPSAQTSGKAAAAKQQSKAGAEEKENRKPAGAEAKKKPGKPVQHTEDKEEGSGRNGKGKGRSSKKAAAAAEEEEEEEDGGSAGSEEEEDERPKKRAKKSGRSSPGAKSGSAAAAAGAAGGAKPKALTSKSIELMKDVCKKATIKIGPTLYARKKSVAELEDALTELLARHGLNARSGEKEISQVRRQLERDRDLEGIDTSNIISLGGGRPRRAAAASVNFRKMFKHADTDSDEGEQE
ncbi:hypothetical protein Agub_g11600, partial [Astrephomene gubernaculifera]